MDIKIGSLVCYTERRSSFRDSERNIPRNGSIGTVVEVTSGYRHSTRAFDVNWHSGGCLKEQKRKLTENGWFAVWTENLDLAEVPYDPTQAGDQDDDI